MKVIPVQNQFNSGMKRDHSRSRMPANSSWNMVDLIPDYDAPARERAGWAYASDDVVALTAAASAVVAGLYPTFSPTAGGAAPQNIGVTEDGYIFKTALSGTPASTAIGAGHVLAQNPVFHGGTAASAATAEYTGLVIFPDSTQAAVPKKYDGVTLSDLGGSPPTARFATIYKDYTVLGDGLVSSIHYPNRIWFSPVGDPDCGFSGSVTAWDTTDSWIDFSLPVAALGATKNVMLVFHDGQISRIRGNTPPPEEDMVVDDPWQKIGLLDPFSITEDQDLLYWCAPEGVFRTDGVTIDNITLKGGMLRYWLDLVADADSTWHFATGIIRNKLLISVYSGTAPSITAQDAFIVDLSSYAWGRISNLPAASFWTGQYGAADDTYFGLANDARVCRSNTMFSGLGDSTYKADADGTAIESMIETPYYELGRPGIKSIKGLHIGYYLSDYATDNPTVDVAYIKTPEATSYTSAATLSENTEYNRVRVPLGGRFYGLALKLTRSNNGDFWGYDITAELNYQQEQKRMS